MKKSRFVKLTTKWIYTSAGEIGSNTKHIRIKTNDDLNVKCLEIDYDNILSNIGKTDYMNTPSATPALMIAHQNEVYPNKAPSQQPFQSYWHSIPLTTEVYSLVSVQAHIGILVRTIETLLGLVDVLEDGDKIDAESISQ